jgi:hypothetical protein
MTPPKIPPGMTHLQYKAALKAVIDQGREKLDQARQHSREHLESAAGLQVGPTESGDGGNGQ